MSCSIYIPLYAILKRGDRVEIKTEVKSMLGNDLAQGGQLLSKKCVHRIVHEYTLVAGKGWLLPVLPDTSPAPILHTVDDEMLLGVTYSGSHTTCTRLCARYGISPRSIIIPFAD